LNVKPGLRAGNIPLYNQWDSDMRLMFGRPHLCSCVQRKLREGDWLDGDWLDLTLSDKCRGNDVIDRDSTDNAVEPKRVDGATEC
jgi:hypothetical protein